MRTELEKYSALWCETYPEKAAQEIAHIRNNHLDMVNRNRMLRYAAAFRYVTADAILAVAQARIKELEDEQRTDP